MIRWPGHIKPGSVSQRDLLGLDWFPTLLAAAGDTGRQGASCSRAQTSAGKTLQGASRRLQPAAVPDRPAGRSPRARSSSTSTTTASWSPCATRTGRSCSASSGREGTLAIWREPFTCLRAPKLFNLRTDPYERADITSNTYYDWMIRALFLVCRRRRWWRSSSGRSRNFRHGRRRRASASTRSWRNCKSRKEAEAAAKRRRLVYLALTLLTGLSPLAELRLPQRRGGL